MIKTLEKSSLSDRVIRLAPGDKPDNRVTSLAPGDTATLREVKATDRLPGAGSEWVK